MAPIKRDTYDGRKNPRGAGPKTPPPPLTKRDTTPKILRYDRGK